MDKINEQTILKNNTCFTYFTGIIRKAFIEYTDGYDNQKLYDFVLDFLQNLNLFAIGKDIEENYCFYIKNNYEEDGYENSSSLSVYMNNSEIEIYKGGYKNGPYGGDSYTEWAACFWKDGSMDMPCESPHIFDEFDRMLNWEECELHIDEPDLYCGDPDALDYEDGYGADDDDEDKENEAEVENDVHPEFVRNEVSPWERRMSYFFPMIQDKSRIETDSNGFSSITLKPGENLDELIKSSHTPFAEELSKIVEDLNWFVAVDNNETIIVWDNMVPVYEDVHIKSSKLTDVAKQVREMVGSLDQTRKTMLNQLIEWEGYDETGKPNDFYEICRLVDQYEKDLKALLTKIDETIKEREEIKQSKATNEWVYVGRFYSMEDVNPFFINHLEPVSDMAKEFDYPLYDVFYKHDHEADSSFEKNDKIRLLAFFDYVIKPVASLLDKAKNEGRTKFYSTVYEIAEKRARSEIGISPDEIDVADYTDDEEITTKYHAYKTLSEYYRRTLIDEQIRKVKDQLEQITGKMFMTNQESFSVCSQALQCTYKNKEAINIPCNDKMEALYSLSAAEFIFNHSAPHLDCSWNKIQGINHD